MSETNTATAAPSAAPGAAPATPAAAAAAPSAPASSTLEHFHRLAVASLKAGASPATPTPAAAPSAGSGSPPAAGTAPTGEASPSPEPEVQTPGTPAEPAPEPAEPAAPGTEAEEPEASAEEQANWTEGERRLHSALQKERGNRKEARQELRTLRQELEDLKSRITQAPPSQPAATQPPATAPQPSAQPEPAAPVQMLTDCITFEAVDARAMQAATTEAQVMRLQTTLTRQGREAAAAALAQAGVKEVNGTALAEASEDQLGDFLSRVYEGARMTQLQAQPRKQFILQQAQSWQATTQEIPELSDPKSPRAQAFLAIVNANPWIRNVGPQWPQIVATQLMGIEARGQAPNAKPQTPSPAAKPATPPPNPAARALPGTPARAAAAMPKKGEEQALREKIANGTATLQEVQKLTAMSLRSSPQPVAA